MARRPCSIFLCDDRTAEFYAGGRLAYQPNGEPIRFDGAQELPPAIRAKGDVALVLVETRWEKQLTDYSGVETERVGSNGWVSCLWCGRGDLHLMLMNDSALSCRNRIRYFLFTNSYSGRTSV